MEGVLASIINHLSSKKIMLGGRNVEPSHPGNHLFHLKFCHQSPIWLWEPFFLHLKLCHQSTIRSWELFFILSYVIIHQLDPGIIFFILNFVTLGGCMKYWANRILATIFFFIFNFVINHQTNPESGNVEAIGSNHLIHLKLYRQSSACFDDITVITRF